MTAISNFTQAVRELTGFDDTAPNGADPEETREPKQTQQREVKISRKSAEFTVPEFDTDGGNLITRTMAVTGQMDCNNQLKVEGRVLGEIRANNAVSISGVVIGNISADSLSVLGKVKGDIVTKDITKIDTESVVVGDIQADSLYVRGRIKGNLTVQGTTEIVEDALIVGDIITGSLESSRGSTIDGKIIIKDRKPFDFDAENLFKIEE